MIGHRIMGTSLGTIGSIVEGRAHLDKAIALYDPSAHRSLATRFGQDVRVASLTYRALGLYVLGYPEAALSDADLALKDGREIAQAGTLMFALTYSSTAHIFVGNYSVANARLEEVIALASEKGASPVIAAAMLMRGWLHAWTGKSSEAVRMLTTGVAAWRATGATLFMPFYLSLLGKAYADLDRWDEARKWIDEAKTILETTNQRWCEAEVLRTAAEIAIMPTC